MTGSGVYLSGTVASDEQRAELAAVASREAGSLPVYNDVVVVHGTPDTDVEVIG